MRGRDGGLTCAEIARRIGRDRSVVWREIQRNSLSDGDYHAGIAHARAARNARRPKACKLDDTGLCSAVGTWMDDGWSPKLIAEVLARDYPDDKLMQVSHETIYQCLYVQTRGQLRADLHKCLSTKRSSRKPRGAAGRTGVYAPGAVFTISDRPAEAADRAVPGHWESQCCCQAASAGVVSGSR
jgi:IS30 family transposase